MKMWVSLGRDLLLGGVLVGLYRRELSKAATSQEVC
jgi:hypothetical protein